MFNSISNMPISRRLLIAFALTAAIPGIVIVLLGSFYINSLTIRGQAVKTSFDAQNTAAAQQVNLESMNAALKTRFALVFARIGGAVKDPTGESTDASLDAIAQQTLLTLEFRKANFDQTLTKYLDTYSLSNSDNMSNIRNIILNDNPNSTIIQQQTNALRVASDRWPEYATQQDTVIKILDKDISNYNAGKISAAMVLPTYQEAYGELYIADSNFTTLRNDWQQVVNLAEQMGKVVTNVGPSQLNPIILTTIIAFLSTVLVIVTTGFIMNLTITRPLRQLASLTRRIAKGDTEARARIAGRDEIYMVANSMNSMLDNIVRLIQETQAQRDNLQAQVEKLVSEVSGVGEGDLRVQAEVTADALGVLADSFNYMVEELSSLVVRVKAVANEVGNSTATILDRMTQLVEAGDNEILQIEEAAVEIDRVASASRQVADRANTLNAVSRKARQDAQNGREALEQSLLGMGRINENVHATADKVQSLDERSREIDEIVTVIGTIAHQTNRLALDAAIQAAMAGENGKGFGAVAADIRRLAERAKEQASSVGRIVRGIREEISTAAGAMQDTERETLVGTRLAQDAGNALAAIFGAVEYQAREIEYINDMATQQLRSSSAVVQIMQGVSASTEQSSMSTRDASQNMERLARLVEQLRASVEAFKLPEDQNFFSNGNNVNIMEEQENQLSISGLFRTVSATAQPAQLSGVGVNNYNPLLPPYTNGNSPYTNGNGNPPYTNGNGNGNPPYTNGNGNDPFSFYPLNPAPPVTPQDQRGWGAPAPTSSPYQPYSDGNNNGNGNNNGWNR